MLHGYAAGFECHGEAVGGRCGGNHGHGRLAVAAIEGLHEVGLLGLGGKAGGGSAALHVDNHEGKLGYYGKTDAFALEGEAGA